MVYSGKTLLKPPTNSFSIPPDLTSSPQPFRIRSLRKGLYNCGIARYSVQFTSGELSNADGVAWVFRRCRGLVEK